MKIIRISVMLLFLASIFACKGTVSNKKQEPAKPEAKVKAQLKSIQIGSYTLKDGDLKEASSNAGFAKTFEKTEPAKVEIKVTPEQDATFTFTEGSKDVNLTKTAQTIKIKVSKTNCDDATYTLILSKKEDENTPPPAPTPKPKAKLTAIQVGSYVLKDTELTEASSNAGFAKIFEKTEPAKIEIKVTPEQDATFAFTEGSKDVNLTKTAQTIKIKVSKTNCDDATYTLILSKKEDENTPPPAPTPEPYQPSTYETMIDVNVPESGIVGKTFNASDLVNDGVFLGGRTVKLSEYRIAKYELTYKIWYDIVEWAKTKGYVFSGEAREAIKGATKGAQPTQEDLPVTYMNWYDAIVWCNAYTERRMGQEHCVYKLNDKNGAALKDATMPELASKVFWDQEQKGFRLASEAEWEYAARYQKDNTNNFGREYGAGVWLTKIDHVSGANTHWKDSSNQDESYAKYCWWHFNPIMAKAHAVGSMQANRLGIHDMSGNLQEWVYDWYLPSIEKTETVENPMGPTFAEAGESGFPQKVLKGGWYSSINLIPCLPANRSGKRTPGNSAREDCTIRLACYK